MWSELNWLDQLLKPNKTKQNKFISPDDFNRPGLLRCNIQNLHDTTQNYIFQKKKNPIIFDWEETINKGRP